MHSPEEYEITKPVLVPAATEDKENRPKAFKYNKVDSKLSYMEPLAENCRLNAEKLADGGTRKIPPTSKCEPSTSIGLIHERLRARVYESIADDGDGSHHEPAADDTSQVTAKECPQSMFRRRIIGLPPSCMELAQAPPFTSFKSYSEIRRDAQVNDDEPLPPLPCSNYAPPRAPSKPPPELTPEQRKQREMLKLHQEQYRMKKEQELREKREREVIDAARHLEMKLERQLLQKEKERKRAKKKQEEEARTNKMIHSWSKTRSEQPSAIRPQSEPSCMGEASFYQAQDVKFTSVTGINSGSASAGRLGARETLQKDGHAMKRNEKCRDESGVYGCTSYDLPACSSDSPTYSSDLPTCSSLPAEGATATQHSSRAGAAAAAGPRGGPGAAPRGGLGAAPRGGPGAAPRGGPGAAPRGGPGAAPRGGLGAAPRGGPGATPVPVADQPLDNSGVLASLFDMALDATAEGAAALGLLCAQLATMDSSTFAQLMQGKRLVLTEAGRMALQAATQQEEPFLPMRVRTAFREYGEDSTEPRNRSDCSRFSASQIEREKKKRRLEEKPTKSASGDNHLPPPPVSSSSTPLNSAVLRDRGVHSASSSRTAQRFSSSSDQYQPSLPHSHSSSFSKDIEMRGADEQRFSFTLHRGTKSRHNIVHGEQNLAFLPNFSSGAASSGVSGGGQLQTTLAHLHNNININNSSTSTTYGIVGNSVIVTDTFQPVTDSTFQPVTDSTFQPVTDSTFQPVTDSTFQPVPDEKSSRAGSIPSLSAVEAADHPQEPLDTGQSNQLTAEEFAALNGLDGNGPIMLQISP